MAKVIAQITFYFLNYAFFTQIVGVMSEDDKAFTENN